MEDFDITFSPVAYHTNYPDSQLEYIDELDLPKVAKEVIDQRITDTKKTLGEKFVWSAQHAFVIKHPNDIRTYARFHSTADEKVQRNFDYLTAVDTTKKKLWRSLSTEVTPTLCDN